MKLTPWAKYCLKIRRTRRKLLNDGWEHVPDGGGKLWELHRGCRYDHRIVAVCIDPDEKTLWVKTAKSNRISRNRK